MSVYEQVKQALQDVVAPELRELRSEIKRLDEKISTQIKALDDKIGVEIKRLDEKIDGLDDRIGSVKTEIVTEIKRLDEKIDRVDEKIDTAMQIRERLAALEAKMATIEH